MLPRHDAHQPSCLYSTRYGKENYTPMHSIRDTLVELGQPQLGPLPVLGKLLQCLQEYGAAVQVAFTYQVDQPLQFRLHIPSFRCTTGSESSELGALVNKWNPCISESLTRQR